MPYVQRNEHGKIVGVFSYLQPKYAEEWLLDSHVEVVAFRTPSDVPQEITRFQGMAQLHIAGLLASVEAIMEDPETDPLVVIAWKNVQVFRRFSPMILAIAPQLGLNDEILDQFFIEGSKIEA